MDLFLILMIIAAIVLFVMSGFNVPHKSWGWFGAAVLAIAALVVRIKALGG